MAGNAHSQAGIVFDLRPATPEGRVQAFLDAYKLKISHDTEHDTFDGPLLRTHLKLLSATTSSPTHAIVTFALNIHPSLCSRAARLHGAAAALVFDMCTTMAVAPLARPDFWHFGGFSRTLSMTYFRPVEEGSRVVVECEVVQIGRSLATIHGKMKRESDGVPLCFAEHNKAAADSTVLRSDVKL